MDLESVSLDRKLQQLDLELEEGEITEKGYQKRRTLILSQYTAPGHTARGLQIHAPDNTIHPSSIGDDSRTTSLAAANQDTTYSTSHHSREPSSVDHRTSDYNYGHASGQLGVRNVSPTINDNVFPRSRDASRRQTMVESQYAFKPEQNGGNDQPQFQDGNISQGHSRQPTVIDQAQFQEFNSQQLPYSERDIYGGGPQRYSQADALSPTANVAHPFPQNSEIPQMAQSGPLLPLEPREVPFAIYDTHNQNVPMAKFENIAAVLRHRGKTNPRRSAFWILDQKGREVASITWEKLASRAEKVAQIIRDKSNLYRGDRVALIYRDIEVIDFTVAFIGCFIAGVVAVPITDFDVSSPTEMADYQRLNVILTTTQAHLALTTDINLKTFQRDIAANKLNWPRGVEWWKTNEFGSFHPKKKEELPALVLPDLAYIEFSRAPTGDLRGVVMSHKTIMHQMACMSAIIHSIPNTSPDSHAQSRNTRSIGDAQTGEILLSYLDPRHSIGLILGVLLSVYGGHTTVWVEPSAVETPGLYANLITKYKTSLMLANYPGLKLAAYNYQQNPLATRNFMKKFEPNFAHVKLCLIDTLTVDSNFHEVLADRWFQPLRNTRAHQIIAPMLCLPEHGGMLISVRDWLGGEERMGCPLQLQNIDEEQSDDEKPVTQLPPTTYGSLIGGGPKKRATPKTQAELSEVLLDKESLKTNEVVVIARGDDVRKKAETEPNAVRVGAFGYPIPDATLAVVDPESSLLCRPYVIGEIWVDSPSLSGGFWALPKHTETIFHAHPFRQLDGRAEPIAIEPEFLRTGLLGCVIEGKVFVLGLYEDRIRQRVEWVEHGMELVEHRYFFVQHLIVTIMKRVTKIHDATAFDVFANDEHLPVIILESFAASTAPLTSGGPPRQLDNALLESLAEKAIEVLLQDHHTRVYCVMITAAGTLPRVSKNGRKEIGNMLCRKQFDSGSLPCVYVKFGVGRAVLNLPIGIDPAGGIWSSQSALARREILQHQDKQYSGVDYRDVVIDDRTSTPLTNFKSIVDLLQWRVARQAEETAYCTMDVRGREGKIVTWKKFDLKVAAVAQYLRNKVKAVPGDRLVLMYTHSEDYVYALHACFCLGVVAIPVPPVDQNRLAEDAPAVLHMIADFRVKAVLVNTDVDHLLRQKVVAQHLKQAASILKITFPPPYNTAKPSKVSTGCRELGHTVKPTWLQPDFPVLIWSYWSPDQRRTSVQLGHDTIMGICKVQKETCQMTSSRPLLGCVRSTVGLGMMHTALMGIFVGAPTYLISPLDFAASPLTLFTTLARHKLKDTYATSQMLDHAMAAMPAKGFSLHELKNMMISTDTRPRQDIFSKVRAHFGGSGLDRTAINTVYSHVLNPMIASRSYMCVEPIELWLDTRALRRGLVYPVDPTTDPHALLVQDSGMVPVSTQIAIVNPETEMLCHIGEYGEIWVQSEACVKAFYGSRDTFDAERFTGRIGDGDPNVCFVRTGDLGFLHNVVRPIGVGGQPVEMQVLFVLGAIGETFEVNGLSHFPVDIEHSVEACHRDIVKGGCAVFQAGGLVVILVEVSRKSYLASMVPVIVNTILNEHQVIVDIVVFVSKGNFPRSRLGEKQRGKILASWVTRKMQTVAQFSIRDGDVREGYITEVVEPAAPGATVGKGSSLRNVETATTPLALQPNLSEPFDYAPLPTGISEMPAYSYDASEAEDEHPINANELDADDREETPTDVRRPQTEFEDYPIPVTSPQSHYSNHDPQAQNPYNLPAPLHIEPISPFNYSTGLPTNSTTSASFQDQSALSPSHAPASTSSTIPSFSRPDAYAHTTTIPLPYSTEGASSSTLPPNIASSLDTNRALQSQQSSLSSLQSDNSYDSSNFPGGGGAYHGAGYRNAT